MAPLNLAGIAPVLRLLWTDSMDITGYTETQNDDGSTNPNAPIAKAEGIKCKLSFSRLDDPENREIDREPLLLIPKVICGTDAPVTKGDLITVRRYDSAGNITATYEGIAGLPAMYGSHQEFEIAEKGQA
jgi:hypothetical protein